MILNILSRFKVKPDPLNADNLRHRDRGDAACLCGARCVRRGYGSLTRARRLSAVGQARGRACREDRPRQGDPADAGRLTPLSTRTRSTSPWSTRIATSSASSTRCSILSAPDRWRRSRRAASQPRHQLCRRGGASQCDRAAQAPHAHDHPGHGCRRRHRSACRSA